MHSSVCVLCVACVRGVCKGAETFTQRGHLLCALRAAAAADHSICLAKWVVSPRQRQHAPVGATGAWTQRPPDLSLITVMRTGVKTSKTSSDCVCSKVQTWPLTTWCAVRVCVCVCGRG